MLEDHLASPVTRKRLRSGPAADHVDGFADWLHKRAYRPGSITPMLRRLAAPRARIPPFRPHHRPG